MTDALGAFINIDDINLFTLSNSLVWTLRLADITVDTFIGY
jgi:hypothetical protein